MDSFWLIRAVEDRAPVRGVGETRREQLCRAIHPLVELWIFDAGQYGQQPCQLILRAQVAQLHDGRDRRRRDDDERSNGGRRA